MAYNTNMIFIETPIFTKRIQKAMDDDVYAALQQELVKHLKLLRQAIESEGLK